ncbi:MAG: sensor domain-containing diguanylate cyclase [Clostridia bacterium]|nr:sensor domain-containing diguanylate cyclase [Clostridia bacterium]
MSRRNSLKKSKSGIIALLSASLFLSGLTGVSVYFFSLWYLHQNPSKIQLILAVFSAAASMLLAIAIVILVLLIKKLSAERTREAELKSFKAFTDCMYHASSETEVYEIFQRHTSSFPMVSHSTLHYTKDHKPDELFWQKITNETIPVCNLPPRSCPVIRFGRDCLVQCIQNDIKCAYQYNDYKHGSYICLPIFVQGHLEAILQLYSKSPYFFDQSFISKVKSHIDILTQAISNKRALSQLSKKASTDKLTRIYNRSYLEPYLENQLEAAQLSNQQLSIIMVDIDHFKSINDTFGHEIGDQVLIMFSELLQKSIRKSDLVARYGGEEFIVVLPSSGIETAVSIAERIRLATSSMQISNSDGITVPPITCSLGVSSYPLHSSSKEKLIKAADIALYKAKKAGRNQTVIYGT